MSPYMCLAVLHTVINLGDIKYKMTFLHEPLQHPPYKNFYKTIVF